MKLISTNVTDSEVTIRFADDEDQKKATRSIDIRVPISELKVPVSESWLKKLDRQAGLVAEPAVQRVQDADQRTLSELKKAALDYAQTILKAMSTKL